MEMNPALILMAKAVLKSSWKWLRAMDPTLKTCAISEKIDDKMVTFIICEGEAQQKILQKAATEISRISQKDGRIWLEKRNDCETEKIRHLVYLERDPDPGFSNSNDDVTPTSRVMAEDGFYWDVVPVK